MADLGAVGQASVEPYTSSTISNLPTFSFTGSLYGGEPYLSSTISNLPTISPVGNLSPGPRIFSPILTLLTPFGTGQYPITGTVKNSSLSFVSRTVVAVDRVTGIIYDKVTSDPVTGAFTLYVPNTLCVVYCLPDINDGVNAEIYDLVVPTGGTAPVPVVDFSGSPVTGETPTTVYFTDFSSNSPESWLWDFKNDGTATSTSQSPNYTYTSAGTYSVKLTATNVFGAGTTTKNSYITVTNPIVTTIFDYTSSVQNYVVPGGVTSLTVKLWGGAGGGNSAISTAGGGGGYTTGTLSVTPSETLSIYVAGGGLFTSNNRAGGSGEGSSAVVRSSTVLAIAPGGGGAANYIAGGGGGLTGQDATSVVSVTTPATGGTQSAGGIGQTGGRNAGISATDGNGADGYQQNGYIGSATWGYTTGGRGGIYSGDGGGGGGGGGYWGGGSGGVNGVGGGTPGAGGSALVPVGGSTLSAVGSTPGNNGDSNRGSAGSGVLSASGNNGRVVIIIGT